MASESLGAGMQVARTPSPIIGLTIKLVWSRKTSQIIGQLKCCLDTHHTSFMVRPIIGDGVLATCIPAPRLSLAINVLSLPTDTVLIITSSHSPLICYYTNFFAHNALHILSSSPP
nr:hypothetical transcript [Hymenolepis microstoma]